MAENQNNLIKRFLLPEKEMSLKVLFDNIRNYAIVGVFIAMGIWFDKGKAIAPPLVFKGPPKNGWAVDAWICFLVAGVLFLLNAGQSYCIANRLWMFVFGDVATTEFERKNIAWHFRLLAWVLAFAGMIVILSGVFVLINLVIFIPWFAAVGSGR
jgi:hypothetical protein